MKRKIFRMLLPVMVLGAGAGLYCLNTKSGAPPEKPPPETRPLTAKEKNPVAESTVPAVTKPRSPSHQQSLRKKAAPPIQANTAKAPARPEAPAAENKRPAQDTWWERHLRQFDRLMNALDRETDPARRRNLIQKLGAYVRVDTLRAMEWAMGLMDPAERRAALEAINRHALVGIGARIEKDRTGYPKIRETTVLSAIEATGQVVPGDYIVGMRDGSGTVISFKDLPVRQIVRRLRGEAGSEVRLLLERDPAGGSPSQPFEVVVQRSLLVIQPPY